MMLRGMPAVTLLILFLLPALLPACGGEKKKPGADIEIDSIADTVRSAPVGELFVSREGGFSVRLPFGFGPPARERATIQGTTGAPGLTVYTSEAGEHAVMIAFTSVPGDDGSDARSRLDAARDAAVRSIGGTLVHESDLEHDGHPGRSITLTAPTPAGRTALGRLDFYLVDGRIYELFYLSPTKQDFASPDVAGFFESFELGEGGGRREKGE